MRRSLLILDVMFVVELDSAVSELSIVNLVAAVAHSARASPMPVHSADELESCDLLVSQVSDDLQHLTSVSVKTEHLQVEETRSVEAILKKQAATYNTSNQEFGTLCVVPELSLHFI